MVTPSDVISSNDPLLMVNGLGDFDEPNAIRLPTTDVNIRRPMQIRSLSSIHEEVNGLNEAL